MDKWCVPGDRVRLVEMPDDPDPIAVGDVGTVLDVSVLPGRDRQDLWSQVDVLWDSGRRLMLTIPPDVVEIISPEYPE